ncbi:MAG: hypothetical protein ACE5R6_12565 [Candidatus Heimdallarchaeota archaeon]
MVQPINLKELEKKAYKATFQDGFLDLFFGVMFTGFGFIPVFVDIGIPRQLVSFLIPILAFFIFFFGKKFITIPRIGHVKFGPNRQSARKKLIIIIIVSVLITWTVYILTVTQTVRFQLSEGLLGTLAMEFLFLTVPLSVMAYFTNFDRLYAYAVMYGLTYPFTEFLHPYMGTPFDSIIAYGISGEISIAVGLLYLIQFLRTYPKIDLNDYHSPITEGSVNDP